jgi:hypothetical protein
VLQLRLSGLVCGSDALAQPCGRATLGGVGVFGLRGRAGRLTSIWPALACMAGSPAAVGTTLVGAADVHPLAEGGGRRGSGDVKRGAKGEEAMRAPSSRDPSALAMAIESFPGR